MTDVTAPLPAAQGLHASFDRVHHALRQANLATRSGGSLQLMACCPVHNDANPSLHVTWRNGARGGYTLLYCHGCAAPATVVAEALGLSLADLFDEPLPERDRALHRVGRSQLQRTAARRRGRLGRLPALLPQAADTPPHTHEWSETERYPYVDVEGRLVQEVVRHECTVTPGERHKRFAQLFVTAGGARSASKPGTFVPVLYRAPRVAAAVRAGETVWLLEGEKDVATAEELGLVATTNTQGGKGFPIELAEMLAGARVTVVLDRDEVGWARGVELHRVLTAVGATVRLKLPGTTVRKSDFTDHVESGRRVEDLLDVDVAEVAVWDVLTPARTKHRALLQALAQVEGHVQLASEVDGSSRREHEQRARRWAVESEVRQEALRELVDRVYGVGLRVGTEWVGEAMQQASELLEAGRLAALRAHELTGLPTPPSLHDPHPSTNRRVELTTSTATAEEESPNEGEATAGRTPPQGMRATATTFRILDGQIVQWEHSRARDAGPDDGTCKTLLTMPVQVIKREFLEEEELGGADTQHLMGRPSWDAQARLNPVSPRLLSSVWVSYPDPVTQEVMHLRVPADKWDDHSWLKSLPGSPDYDHKRAGLDTVQRAVLAVSANVEDSVLYRSTGWRPDGPNHKFVHAGGAITATGAVAAPVAFSGPLTRYNLPDPISDPARLREAFLEHCTSMLTRLPARVAAPLLGQVFRSVLGHNPWVLALVGPPGSYKTSVASKAMHCLGELWDHRGKPGSSMSGNGDTLNALRLKLHAANDVLYWMDDYAPTKSWLDAQKTLEETARLIHNQEARSRSTRDGQSTTDGTPPRASGLATSEVMPRPGSGADRMLVVPLARDEVDTAQLFPLDAAESRHGRALVMASFLQWLAADLPARQHHYADLGQQHAAALTRQGETVRQAEALAQTRIGWDALTDFLTDIHAISTDERDQLLTQIDQALNEAAQAATDPDLPTRTGARVRQLLAYGLRAGLLHVADARTGDCPPWPLAARLGWRRTVTDVDAVTLAPTRSRLDRLGQFVGHVLHDPGPKERRGAVLMMDLEALEGAVKLVSATQAEQFPIDVRTICRALYDEGVLIADECEQANGKTRFTAKCSIYCEDRVGRMVVLRLGRVLGDEPNDLGSTPTNGPDPVGSGSGSEPALGVGPDPHPVDGSQHLLVASPEPTEEELVMAEFVFVPQPYTDRDGVVGWSELPAATPKPCVVCAGPCTMVLSGVLVHPLCWGRTSAGERARPQLAASIPNVGRGQVTPLPAAAPAGAVAAPSSSGADLVQASDERRLEARSPNSADPPEEARPQQAPATRAGAASRAASRFRAAAAVVDVDGIWCSNGERVDPPGPLRHAGDLVRLAQWLELGTQVSRYRNASGQLWVAEHLLRNMGVDVDAITAADFTKRDEVARHITAGHPVVTEASAAGYVVGGRDGNSLGRWTRVWKDGDKSTWLVLMPALNWDGDEVPLLRGAPDHTTLSRRLGLFADALGHPYQLSGSTTGIDLMEALRYRDREALFAAREPIRPAMANIELDLSWCRPPTAEEAEHRFVHAYDRAGSYLAGVAGLELGIGDPVHHGDGCAFEPKTPGYYLIEVPDAGDWRMPHPLDPRGRDAGRTRWVTTPSLEFALEQGYEPRIIEAYTWPEHLRILDPWYERIRDARTRLDVDDLDAQLARDQLKMVYAPTIGMLGSHAHMAGRAGYAPERRHLIIAKARTNILRRVARIGQDTGRWPVAVAADTIIYTSPCEDPAVAWPGTPAQLGRALGQYKPEGSGLLQDQLPYLSGGAYRGKQALVDTAPGSE